MCPVTYTNHVVFSQVMSSLNAEEYLSGKCFEQPAVSSAPVLNKLFRQPSKQTGVCMLLEFFSIDLICSFARGVAK